MLLTAFKLRANKTLHHVHADPASARRSLKALLVMSLPWVSQSHMYGYAANSLLGEYGDAIGWPILIVTTNVTGLVVGWKVLGEWDNARPRTKSWVMKSIVLSGVGVAVVAGGGFV